MTVEPKTRRGKDFRQMVTEAKERIQEIDADTLKAWMAEGKKFILIDAREAIDYGQGHIKGALTVPRGIMEIDIDEVVPDQDQTVVVYCGGGSRSALAADTLQVMGYEHVYSLAKGYRGWVEKFGEKAPTPTSAEPSDLYNPHDSLEG